MLMYGFHPRSPIMVETETIKVQKVADFLREMQEMLQLAHENVLIAWDRVKHFANLKRSPREFQVGDWIYLRILKDSKVMHTRKHYKLSAHYSGPYKILKNIGSLAYRLDLPDEIKAHPVFHVSRLKMSLHEGDHLGSGKSLNSFEDLSERIPLEPEKILDTRTKRLPNREVIEHLVRWKGHSDDEDSWELEGNLKRSYPDFMF
ncbi:hypothetical protein O6H91_22G048100 [Diphasiastrum complanatum]|uniref:Uncharacterized protein n=1 Tax=Diphasiastrum complanatum TaxID=34168 RepID=A0ACC2AFH8_DIPCM|nr:hypothetical protein O6H91_22G048100 [Diphasiastrum complanatum]